MNAQITKFLDDRRGRLEAALGKPLQRPSMPETQPLTDDERRYLRGEAEDLYWNELEWENITDEEALDDGPVAELTFPGLLAYVRGLLLSEVMPDSLSPANPRPGVVAALLEFLAARVVELEDGLAAPTVADQERLRAELDLTSNVIDRVLYLYHGLTPMDIEQIEGAGAST